MNKSKKQELTIFLIILVIASFFRFYSMVPIATMGTIVSPVIGILTVIGLYLLAKELFEWRLAAIAGYLTAISFWHVVFSRTNSWVITIPFILVWAFYFLWKGIKENHLPYFIVAGIFGGAGFYSYGFYWLTVLVAMALFLNYWWYLKKDFSHSKYEHAKTRLLQGFVLLALSSFVVALPSVWSFWQSQQYLFPTGRISLENIVKTFGMFNFSDSPLLPWPIGVFFVIGFINEFIHWLKRKHGHLSTTHTLLFSWFFIMLIPGFLSSHAPDFSLTIGVLPAVMIITARGIWWFFDKLRSWYSLRDPYPHESHAITALVLIIFLFSVGFMEYWRYFVK